MAEVISLTGMLHFFKEDMNCLEKGELKYKSNFVLDLKLIGHEVQAAVRASMKDKSYMVKVKIDGDGGIASALCECPRGKWLCSHMAATAIYVNKKGFSKTDLPNSWIARPKKASNVETKQMSELFPPPKPGYRATSREVSDEDRAFFFKSLCETGLKCPFQWVLGPEPQQTYLHDPLMPSLIEDLIEDFVKNKQSFIEKCRVTVEQIAWLASNTVGQRLSPMWGKFRRLRLTGSSFGEVLNAIKRNQSQNRPYPPSLFKKLKGEYSFGTKDSIMWGQMHEDSAIQDYMKITGNSVAETGIHLFPCGFLGSSPDGIITVPGDPENKGVLEVKCPFKHRNSNISEMIQQELPEGSKASSFCLTRDGNLRKNHNYWHQVQAEMAAAAVPWAHFVLWTTKETHFVRVESDPEWKKISIPLLEEFYMNELLPCFYTKDK